MRISDWSSDVCSSDLFTRKGWLAVIDTNLNGTWWMMQEAAKRWRTDGTPGNILNIVANVERGMPQAAHTCAARAGVLYLSKPLDRKSTRLNPSHYCAPRMPSSA